MASQLPDFDKFTVAELKTELITRGLENTGKKPVLLKRLRDYEKKRQDGVLSKTEPDENGMEVDGEGVKKEINVKKEDNAEEFPNITKGKFLFVYNAFSGLRTVIIQPFKPEVMFSSLIKWMHQAKEYNIKLERDGTSAAMLYFETLEEGDGCFAELRGTFSQDDINVYHPALNPKMEGVKNKTFDKLFSSKLEDDVFHRQVILENVPETVQETSIKEMFPDAFNVIKYDPLLPYAKGLVTFEVENSTKVEEIVKNHQELMIDGEKIVVSKLTTCLNRWGKLKGIFKSAAKAEKENDSEPIKEEDLTDEVRIAKCEELKGMILDREAVQNREDIFGGEKIKAHFETQNDIKSLENLIKVDTDRRIKAKLLTFPEDEDIMPTHVKLMLEKAKRAEEDDKVKKEKKERQEAEAKKRASSATTTKGFPPKKKTNFGSTTKAKAPGSYQSGWNRSQSAYQDRYSGGYNQGMGGGYNQGQQGMGRTGGYSGVRGTGNVPSLFDTDIGMDNMRGGMYGGDDYDGGQGHNNSVESMVMSLTEKLSRLERMQLDQVRDQRVEPPGLMSRMDAFSTEESFGGRLKPDPLLAGPVGMRRQGYSSVGNRSYMGYRY